MTCTRPRPPPRSPPPRSLFQVGLWGAETGDEMGSGETYDGDGVGTNISAEANHP